MKKIVKAVLKISFVFYLLVLVYLLFLGTRTILWSDISWLEYIRNSSNFVPFKTITTYILAMFDSSMNMYIPIENLFGNFMMFMPMGIYLPYLFKHLNKFSRFTISLIIMLIVIEVVQVVTRLGSFDIDDFILNMLGAWIGYGIWKTKAVQYLLK